MNLLDGLKEYQKDADFWKFTLDLENFAKEIFSTLSHYENNPSKEALSTCKKFLLEVERWKAMCIQDQIGMASRNSELAVWTALRGTIIAKNDIDALKSVMSLIGFGASFDPETGLRRAKKATAVLRFLNPYNWGVVDWRNAVILGLLKKCEWDVDNALIQAKRKNPRDLRQHLDIINEDWACQINQDYRAIRNKELPRAADVDMALFGLSLKAWPL